MFYEICETNLADGTHAYVHGLATATCIIRPAANDGWYEVKTSRRSNGSIRYRGFSSYVHAVRYATAYAERIGKSKIERQAQARKRIDSVSLASLGLVSDGEVRL